MGEAGVAAIDHIHLNLVCIDTAHERDSYTTIVTA